MIRLFVWFMDFIIFPFLVVYGILSKSEYAIYAANLTIFLIMVQLVLFVILAILLIPMYEMGMLDDKEKMMSYKNFRNLKEKSVKRNILFILDCVLIGFMAATGHFIIASLYMLSVCIGVIIIRILLTAKKRFEEDENDTISNIQKNSTCVSMN